jgi:hypothetical protein
MLAATTSVTGCLGSSSTRGLGDEVRNGQFAFTVTALDLGVPNIASKTAQCVFVCRRSTCRVARYRPSSRSTTPYSRSAAVQVLSGR